jgi:CobQ-like glutamine amidotransferase family enzyme
MTLSIIRLYHDLLGTYGDQGNAEVLIHRAKARDLEVELIEVAPGQAVPRNGDIYLLGGGEDGPQLAALEMLRQDGGLNYAAAGGATVFAVCAGFQIIGTSLDSIDGKLSGLGLVDADTVYTSAPRSVGELVVQPLRGGLPVLTGFENHQGLTELGSEMPPLGTVISGNGNGFNESEGVWHGNVFGTYMHGPALARNPELADVVLQSAVGLLRPFLDPMAQALAAERRHTLNGN